MSKDVTEEYKIAITRLFTERTNERFLNDSVNHAKLLVSLMIGEAKKASVDIYSGALPASCFQDALEKSGSQKIRIVLDDDSGLRTINALSPSAKSKVDARVIPKTYAGERGNHFFIAGNSVRLELDHEDATAIANFNEPDAELVLLKDRFEKLWSIGVSN